MDDREVAGYWDANAPDWIEAVRAGWDVYREYVNNPAFFQLLGDLAGLDVLDIGCGEGYNTRKLADLGARAVGIDVSEAMIRAALHHEADQPRGIEYHVASGSDLGRFADESFDAVLSMMAMMDMPDYAGCVGESARVLKGPGLLQISISHPCTMTRPWKWVTGDEGRREGVVVGDYFSLEPSSEVEDVEEWYFSAAPPQVKAAARAFRIPRFFRTLSEYFNTLVEAGFRVDHMVEPHADESAVRRCPSVADTRVVPYFLIFQCRLR